MKNTATEAPAAGARTRDGADAGGPWRLEVGLRLDSKGPEVAREPVQEADLMDARAELWLEGVLRRGRPDVPLEETAMKIEPIFSKTAISCTGFIATLDGGPDSRPTFLGFSPRSLEHVAARGAEKLVARGVRQPGQQYYFELCPERGPASAESAAGKGELAFTVQTRVEPLAVLSVPLASVMHRARAIGEINEQQGCPVFYTEAALARAEAIARKGGALQPPVETGGVLVGPLCSCPDSGDLFLVVREIIEAVDAEKTTFSLCYSGKTWGLIQQVIRSRRSREETRADRILGQAHGHNFIPLDGEPPCAACSRLPVCGRSSVFVSLDDLAWSRAVFRRQPWHLCHIFGLNARNEGVHGLFGMRDGQLLSRGFRVIPDFTPEAEGESDMRQVNEI